MDDPLRPKALFISIRQWRTPLVMVFIEVPVFTAAIKRIMSDEEYGRLQEALVEFPLLGQLIPQSGGLRKLRWRLRGRGKRGGARVIYYFIGEAE